MAGKGIRISGGSFKGQTIAVPSSEDRRARLPAPRPTTALVRESVFSQITARLTIPWESVCFLDLFAGSGLMGFEALSRGAGQVIAVEQSAQHGKIIVQNAEKLRLESPTPYCLVRQDVMRFSSAPPASYSEKITSFIQQNVPFEGAHVIYADPPYGFTQFETLFEQLVHRHWLHPEGMVFFESDPSTSHLPEFTTRQYGDTLLHLYHRN